MHHLLCMLCLKNRCIKLKDYNNDITYVFLNEQLQLHARRHAFTMFIQFFDRWNFIMTKKTLKRTKICIFYNFFMFLIEKHTFDKISSKNFLRSYLITLKNTACTYYLCINKNEEINLKRLNIINEFFLT